MSGIALMSTIVLHCETNIITWQTYRLRKSFRFRVKTYDLYSQTFLQLYKYLKKMSIMDVRHGTPLVINAMSNEHGLLYVPLANSILSPWPGLEGGSPKKVKRW